MSRHRSADLVPAADPDVDPAMAASGGLVLDVRPWYAWRIERRARPGNIALYRFGAVLVALVIALGATSMLSGSTPSTFYSTAWRGTFGTPLGFSNVLAAAVPLVIAGLAAGIPYRLGLINLGIDGQMLMGAWLAAAIAFSLEGMSGALLIPLMIIGAAVGGAILISIAAFGRAYLGVNEIVTTFLLNFVAFQWLTYWVRGPWVDQGAAGFSSRQLPEQTAFQLWHLGDVQVHAGVVITLALVVAVWAVLRFTRAGYEVKIVGASEQTGRYAGIHTKRKLVEVMLIGGAIGGIAGAVSMMGDVHAFSDGLTNNTGFSGLVVAVLALGSAVGILFVGTLYAALFAGGAALSVAGISTETVFALIGITLLAGATGDALSRFRLVRARPRSERSGTEAGPPRPSPPRDTVTER